MYVYVLCMNCWLGDPSETHFGFGPQRKETSEVDVNMWMHFPHLLTHAPAYPEVPRRISDMRNMDVIPIGQFWKMSVRPRI